MRVLKQVAKGGVLEGLGVWVALAGAMGAQAATQGLYGLVLTSIPWWCFGMLASIGGVMFFLGPMVFGSASTAARRALSDPSRPLLLYLRPFELDTRSVLHLMLGASVGVLTSLVLLGEVWWLLSLVPLAVNISKEQSFGYVFGDIIAFGEPGRRLDPLGASRHHTGDTWKEEITQHMARARLVIVRPAGVVQAGEARSIHWEVEQVLETVPPERILFYLRFPGWGKRSRQSYEAFRALLYTKRAVDLPPRLGKARYLAFDADWNPRLARENNNLLKHIYLYVTSYADLHTERLRPVLEAIDMEVPRTKYNLFEKLMLGAMKGLAGMALVLTAIVLLWAAYVAAFAFFNRL